MIFIIGGKSQGKTEYAIKNYVRERKIHNGADMDISLTENISCVDDFHLLAKRITEQGGNPTEYAEKLYKSNPDIVIISAETGGGIVPVDGFERLWRENTGRACCYIAAHSEKVIRMICGIPTVIKESIK